MTHTPTVDEIHEFGRAIGIDTIPVHRGYEMWWNVLHELGHYAVKTDAYIQLWQQHNKTEKEVPYFNWFESSYETWISEQKELIFGPSETWNVGNPEFNERYKIVDEALRGHDVLNYVDPKGEGQVEMQSTPGELGVRIWCLEVLQVKSWTNPLECQEWRTPTPQMNRVDKQWGFGSRSKEKDAAIKQLKRAGINPGKGKFRPTKLPPKMAILIALGNLDAMYGEDFRTIATPHRGYEIQLQCEEIAARLEAGNKKQWQRWINRGVLCL